MNHPKNIKVFQRFLQKRLQIVASRRQNGLVVGLKKQAAIEGRRFLLLKINDQKVRLYKRDFSLGELEEKHIHSGTLSRKKEKH